MQLSQEREGSMALYPYVYTVEALLGSMNTHGSMAVLLSGMKKKEIKNTKSLV